jgi:hypothetical protein
MKKLSAQGEEAQDLLVPLFKGYKQCKNSADKIKIKGFKFSPKSGESTPNEVNGKVWYCCKNHKSWTRHTASERKGINFTSLRRKPAATKIYLKQPQILNSD